MTNSVLLGSKDAVASPGVPLSRLGASVTLALCYLAAVLEGYDFQVLTIAAPLLMKGLHLSPQQLGWVFSSTVVGLAAGSAVGGALADRIGRKRVLVGSVLLLGATTFAIALASGFRTLLALRCLGGFAMGGVMPSMIIIACSVASELRKVSVVTAISCGMLAGGVLAAIIGHALADRIGWKGLFAVGGVLPTLLAPAASRLLTDVRARLPGRRPATSYREALFGQGLGTATLLLWLLFIITLTILALLLGWAPTLIIDKGLPPSVGFTTMLVLNIGGIVGSLVLGRLCELWSVRSVMFLVYLGTAASLTGFALSHSETEILPIAAASGFIAHGAQMALYGFSPRLYPEANHGTTVGAAMAAGRVGSFLGPVIGGQLLGAGVSGADVLLRVPVPLAVLGALILLGLAAVSGGALGPNPSPR
jgi:AAHS family 3-hydroxyphenylpropionic acid transporter